MFCSQKYTLLVWLFVAAFSIEQPGFDKRTHVYVNMLYIFVINLSYIHNIVQQRINNNKDHNALNLLGEVQLTMNQSKFVFISSWFFFRGMYYQNIKVLFVLFELFETPIDSNHKIQQLWFEIIIE